MLRKRGADLHMVSEQWVQVAECLFLLRERSQTVMSSGEFLTRNLHSQLARSRRPYHPIVFVDLFSTHSPTFHRRHHSNTASLERDEVFVPKLKSSIGWYSKYLNNPPGRILTVIITLTLGWPLYLMFNVSGRHYDRFACHYDPYGPIYSDRERLQIYLSDAGVLGVSYVLYRFALVKGLAWVLCLYGGPLLIVNGFLVLITWLQHTHPALPHYDSSEWDWLRGALATCDRDYGILNKLNTRRAVWSENHSHNLAPSVGT
ncbi:hypothetical protein HYC85_022497 [Camellia sinensis]|uniref:Fatty acid desaturase domain-containing protein n=1 Tax=Camellia sinensis TaxID=4442 RepID=A0A7J7GKY3_CAMSI|nr:hypothetical protein HYC85_022497 [Camellia sinensis]